MYDLQWICALLLLCVAIIPLDWSEMKLHPSLASTKTSSTLAESLQGLAGVELATILIFIGTLVFNKRKRNKMLSAPLTEKYQVDENIRSLRIIIPIIATHFCCFMPQLVTHSIHLIMIASSSLNLSEYIISLETYNTNQFYGVLLPIILFWSHKALRQYLKTALNGNGAIANETVYINEAGQEQVLHFAMLRQVWGRS